MKKKNELIVLNGIDNLSEDEKLELFKVEELETRLEMLAAIDPGDGGGGGGGGTVNGACIPVEVNGVCW